MTKVVIEVDPHKLSTTIEVVDHHETMLGSGRFSTDQAGYTALRTYAKNWPERAASIRRYRLRGIDRTCRDSVAQT